MVPHLQNNPTIVMWLRAMVCLASEWKTMIYLAMGSKIILTKFMGSLFNNNTIQQVPKTRSCLDGLTFANLDIQKSLSPFQTTTPLKNGEHKNIAEGKDTQNIIFQRRLLTILKRLPLQQNSQKILMNTFYDSHHVYVYRLNLVQLFIIVLTIFRLKVYSHSHPFGEQKHRCEIIVIDRFFFTQLLF